MRDLTSPKGVDAARSSQRREWKSLVADHFNRMESEAALAPLEQGAMVKKALSKVLNERSNFDQLAIASGETWPENHRNLCENQCSKAKPSDMLVALRDLFIRAPSPK